MLYIYIYLYILYIFIYLSFIILLISFILLYLLYYVFIYVFTAQSVFERTYNKLAVILLTVKKIEEDGAVDNGNFFSHCMNVFLILLKYLTVVYIIWTSLRKKENLKMHALFTANPGYKYWTVTNLLVLTWQNLPPHSPLQNLTFDFGMHLKRALLVTCSLICSSTRLIGRPPKVGAVSHSCASPNTVAGVLETADGEV